MKGINFLVVLFIIILGVCGISNGQQGLRKNYYAKSCPIAETIVKQISEKLVAQNANVAARLLRLHFHDCFVRVRICIYIYIYAKNPSVSLCKNRGNYLLLTCGSCLCLTL